MNHGQARTSAIISEPGHERAFIRRTGCARHDPTVEGHDAALNDLDGNGTAQGYFTFSSAACKMRKTPLTSHKKPSWRVYQNRTKFRRDAKFTTWLYTSRRIW